VEEDRLDGLALGGGLDQLDGLRARLDKAVDADRRDLTAKRRLHPVEIGGDAHQCDDGDGQDSEGAHPPEAGAAPEPPPLQDRLGIHAKTPPAERLTA
jgi:hypothetical protein